MCAEFFYIKLSLQSWSFGIYVFIYVYIFNVIIFRIMSRKPGMLKSFGIVYLGCHYMLVKNRIKISVEKNKESQHLKRKR